MVSGTERSSSDEMPASPSSLAGKLKRGAMTSSSDKTSNSSSSVVAAFNASIALKENKSISFIFQEIWEIKKYESYFCQIS
jgi:hypothetical protein